MNQTGEIKMARSEKGKISADAWDDGKLGRDEKFVRVADAAEGGAVDEALSLKLISIRLPKKLINQFKLIGHFHGVGYQPLMRDIMARYARNEILDILRKQAEIAKEDNERKTREDKVKKAA